MSDEEQPRLPDYFPLAPKGCAKQANAFFECFAAAGAQAPDTADADAGRRGLVECAKTLGTYKKCMSWWLKRNSMPEIYRVGCSRF
mmetsp:Transcript_10613/g.34798  ORF Transcript_10613/g.34798 Transcript_10613/m.34798 type:complete len:86 (-) Transcript_10613:100-357(-)